MAPAYQKPRVFEHLFGFDLLKDLPLISDDKWHLGYVVDQHVLCFNVTQSCSSYAWYIDSIV